MDYGIYCVFFIKKIKGYPHRCEWLRWTELIDSSIDKEILHIVRSGGEKKCLTHRNLYRNQSICNQYNQIFDLLH